jgi:DNA-directed RNA polymerase subunit RPC12/RpoP
MSITVTCTSCGKNYEMDDSQAGKKLACTCGQILLVQSKSSLAITPAGSGGTVSPPVPPIPPGLEPPNAVQGDVVNESPVKPALQIGIKKDTTQAHVNAIEENFPAPKSERKSTIANLLPLINVIVVLLVLGSLCTVVYYFVTKKNYGISSSSPMGTFAELNKHLMKMKLTRNKKAKPTSKAFGKKGKVVIYRDERLREKSRNILFESVFLVIDSDRNVLAVGGTFHTSAVALPGTTANRVGRFLNHYWKEIGCKDPNFKITEKGEFGDAVRMKCAYGNNKVKVKWTKDKIGIALYEWQNVIYVVNKDCSFSISQSLFDIWNK